MAESKVGKLKVPADMPIKMPSLSGGVLRVPDISKLKDLTAKVPKEIPKIPKFEPKKLVVKGLVKLGLQKHHCLNARKTAACCKSCWVCCCICYSRIPCITLIAAFWLALGYTGFALGLYEGVFHLNKFLKMDMIGMARMGIMALGLFLGGMSGLAVLNGIAATGRTRYNVYSGWKSKLTGRCCIILLFGWHGLVWLIWTIMGPLLLFPVIVMGIAFAVCQVKLVKQLGKTCIEFKEYGIDDIVKMDVLCGHDLIEFCGAMTGATPYFVAAFVGGIFIIIGVMIMLLALAVNVILVHKHRKETRPSEISTCRVCCNIRDPEKYDDCWPEPPVEEVQLSMRQKLLKDKGDKAGFEHNPHGQEKWSYVYDYHREPKPAGKRY
ncbi:uncharacterized protein LOC116604577 [Nematostella vectensis]|uniref:uncharacterized protein LOC116604577 n=1 Tax=Nematostella vectensis TaxID=45351 RepID=UPI002077913D|nr:uncharacterized protein LOC116604577 [Nematostella vectensis]